MQHNLETHLSLGNQAGPAELLIRKTFQEGSSHVVLPELSHATFEIPQHEQIPHAIAQTFFQSVYLHKSVILTMSFVVHVANLVGTGVFKSKLLLF